jgi:hypothetical protein
MRCVTTALGRCLALAVITTNGFGQLRLYDSGADDLAKKTQSAFEEFSKGDSNIFETMVANTLALKEATLTQLYDLNKQAVQAKVNVIPEWTWTRLREEVKTSQGDFLDAYKAAQVIFSGSPSTVSSASAALKEAQARLKTLSDQKTAKAQALGDPTKTGESSNLKNMQDALKKVRDGVAASTKPIHSLSDLAEFQNLKTVWSGIQDAKSWLDAVEKSTSAPGLQLTILDMAVQRQQIKVDRLQLDLDHASAEQEIAARIARRLEQVWRDGSLNSSNELRQGEFGIVYSYLEICSPSDECQHRFLTAAPNLNEQVMQTIGRLSMLANTEIARPLDSTLTLRNLLDILGRYVSLIGYQRYLLASDMIEAVTEDQIFAIRESALNTKERSVLISHGLQGLAAYHAGGIKPEDIANMMRAAQTAASAVIAARVN